MRKIYFDHRFICICTSKSHYLKDPDAIMYFPSDMCERYSDIVENMLDPENTSNFYITSSDQAAVYEHLKTNFTEINAAGGLVKNQNGDILMIFRNGFWDLPKGKQESGEDTAECALREVREECGLSGLKLGDLICVTDHTYRRDGKLMLKHTYWYRMECEDDGQELIPQTEEGISQVKWVKESEILLYMGNTYPTIRDVINESIYNK